MPEPLGNILVVDDVEAISKALRDLLTMNGYTVRIAPSGERALQIMETAQIDLVITDLKMSGISGLELLKRIKDKSPALPVVILTGFGGMDDVIEAMHFGVADYLKKPFSVDEVLQVTARELMRSRQGQLPASIVEAVADSSKPQSRLSRRFAFSTLQDRRLDSILSELRAQTSAESVLLIEDTGNLISSKGMSGGLDMVSLAALFIGSRKTMTQLAALLREEATFSLSFFEGQRVAVYAAGTSQGLMVVMVVPKSVKQGTVLVYARKAAAEIEQIAASAMVLPEPAAPASEPKPQPELEPDASQSAPQPKPAEPPVLDVELFTKVTPQVESDAGGPVETLTWEEAVARGLLGSDFKL
jgi:DNA-binding response OmpR family regulator